MKFPDKLYYTENHEWIEFVDEIAIVGITDFAQRELGDIVFVEIETVGRELNENDVFGTIEAVKTVSDLFLPISGEILSVNPAVNETPEIVNSDPYNNGWIVKVKPKNVIEKSKLLTSKEYMVLLGL